MYTVAEVVLGAGNSRNRTVPPRAWAAVEGTGQ